MAVRVRRSVVVSDLIVLVELAEVVVLLFGFMDYFGEMPD